MAISDMGIAQIREGLASKQFTACEVAQASLDRIAQADSQVHAFLEVTSEAAMAAAQRVDQAIADGTFDTLGPLAGVPVAFKDNMNMTGTHTTCSSRMLENYVSPYTATCVQRIIDAGGVPLGKLNMDEFAFGSTTESSAFGPTRNPWDLGRVPGGSSGGSAAAVAAGMACVTLGSDTGGSIRQPASFCGIVGVKPTYGTVSRYGVVAFGSSLDQVGPFARSVEDAAAAMDALCGHDPLDCTSQDVKAGFRAACQQDVAGMRVGVVRSFMDAKGLVPDPAQTIISAKCRQQQCSTGQFKQGGDPQNKACQPHDAAHLRGSRSFLHRAALLEGDLSPRKQRKGSTHCNDTQSSDLDQKKDHTLPKSRPVAAGILYHKAGHAKGRSGGKQCLMERCDAPLLRSNRKHQKQRAHQINCRKTCNNDLKRRKTVPLVTRILNHKSSFTYPCA